jgi:two-component system KDP operon response regulator KdpE
MKRRVLAVDDEPRYLRLIRLNLEAAGYEVFTASGGVEAVDVLAAQPLDLVLLDVRMDGQDGFALLQEIRQTSDVPVIFVTAAGEEADKVRGLGLGADDYLTKPFGAPELLARVQAVLRRYDGASGRANDAEVALGDVRIDTSQRRVFRGKHEVHLSRTEFRLLACLVRHRDKVIPQEQLVREVWGSGYDGDFEGLRVYVYRLRHKLEEGADAPRLLQTFPGVGYLIQTPASVHAAVTP